MSQSEIVSDFVHLGTSTHAPIIVVQTDVSIDDPKRRPIAVSFVCNCPRRHENHDVVAQGIQIVIREVSTKLI